VRRIRLTLQYDGAAFEGWQIQPRGTTIQGLLEDCICRLTGEQAKVIGAGRTDAGVHALQQVAAFDSDSALPVDVIRRALNAMLPHGIRVMDAGDARQDFHPRYGARSKSYVYMIANMKDVPVFIDRYVWSITCPLDPEAMKAASAHLVGRHDFSSFRGSGCGARSVVRTVFSLGVERLGEAPFLFTGFQGEFICIRVEADAFLRHMVRNIVGTLVEAGRGRLSPERVKTILGSRDRKLAGPTAPAKGLFLENVTY
jgi:tRNA pseudouridine38-40 synthase